MKTDQSICFSLYIKYENHVYRPIFFCSFSVFPDCQLNEFMCDNKRCIDILLICDGKNDCMDESDERNCGTFVVVCLLVFLDDSQ